MPSSTTNSPRAPGDAELEPRIEERIRAFDVTALLQLLEEMGYRPDQIGRAGHPAESPQPAWLDSIRFRHHHHLGQAATVFANLGLASCRTPLPAYFREFKGQPDVDDPLGELFDLLDDRLLERRFASYAPERDRKIFPDEGGPGGRASPRNTWLEAKRDLLTLTALRSPSALHWLFAKVYPELRVTVRRAPQDRRIATPEVRLGVSPIGLAALGGEARLPVRGLEVTLLCEHRLAPILDADQVPLPWVRVAEERLEALIFPVLRETGVQLEVSLLLLDRGAAARLDGEAARVDELSYVGYDPLAPDPGAVPETSERVVLLSGPIPPERTPAR